MDYSSKCREKPGSTIQRIRRRFDVLWTCVFVLGVGAGIGLWRVSGQVEYLLLCGIPPILGWSYCHFYILSLRRRSSTRNVRRHLNGVRTIGWLVIGMWPLAALTVGVKMWNTKEPLGF